MTTFLKIAAHSVDHMFPLYFLLFVILIISRFGFEGWIWVLIASVPDLCIFFNDLTVRVRRLGYGFVTSMGLISYSYDGVQILPLNNKLHNKV